MNTDKLEIQEKKKPSVASIIYRKEGRKAVRNQN